MFNYIMNNIIKYCILLAIITIIYRVFIYYKSYKIIYIPNNPGQITMESSFGQEIFNICKETNYRNIIEIGSWNGQGSTICVMNAIINKDNSILYSFESDLDKYNDCKKFWNSQQTFNKLKLFNGVLHKKIDHISDIEDKHFNDEWYNKEKKTNNNSKIIDISNITDIDIIILDGGEYSTNNDYDILITKNPSVIILDDVNVNKCKKIRNRLLNNDIYDIYNEDLNDRNGWSIFIK